MIPSQTFENYPIFGGNATKVEPGDAKKSAGFQQADVLPAEWMNWAWNKNSKGISDLNEGVTSLEKEVNNVLAEAHITPSSDTNVNDQLYKAIRQNCGCIITTSATITNAPSIASGNVIKVMFTQEIAGVDATTGFNISYNGTTIPVKVYKDGTLADFTAAKVSWEDATVSYKFLDAGTTLELAYDSVNFIIMNNPVVLSSVRYSIHADGTVEGGHVGLTAISFTDTLDYGWLACEHQSLLRADYPRLFSYFQTHKIGSSTMLDIFGAADSTHFYLPDTREAALVGAGQNDSESIANHDVYTVGQYKDDGMQEHTHKFTYTGAVSAYTPAGGGNQSAYAYSFNAVTQGLHNGRITSEGVTRGKRKGAKFIIKVL